MKMDMTDLKREESLPVILVDTNGLILKINAAFENEFGWQKTDLEGRALNHIIPDELQDAHAMGFSRYLITQKSRILFQPLDLKIKTKGGAVIFAQHYIIAEQEGADPIFGAIITTRKMKVSPSDVG